MDYDTGSKMGVQYGRRDCVLKIQNFHLRNSYTILTKLRYKHVWLLKYALVFLRANYADGYKAVNLARKTRRDKKLANLKSGA